MTAAWLADAVTSNLEGQDDAKRFLESLLRQCGTGDELHLQILKLSEAGDLARLRGFCRHLQKVIERAGS